MKFRRLLTRLWWAGGALLALGAIYAVVSWWQSVPRRTTTPLVVNAGVPADVERLRFFVLGDTGTGGEPQMQVARAMAERCQSGERPDGILLLGDNFYQSGVESTEDPQWEEKMWKPYGLPCLAELPIYAVLGNHDYKGNIEAQIAMTALKPGRWVMPHRYFSIHFGSLLQIAATDTNLLDLCFDPTSCALDELDQALDEHDSFRWNLVMGHHPLASASGKYGRNIILSETLSHVLCGRADAYVAGHSHHLEFRRGEDCPLDLVIAGGGGGDLYPLHEGDPATLYQAAVYGFVELGVDRERLEWRYFDRDGRQLFATRTVMPDSAAPGTITKSRRGDHSGI